MSSPNTIKVDESARLWIAWKRWNGRFLLLALSSTIAGITSGISTCVT